MEQVFGESFDLTLQDGYWALLKESFRQKITRQSYLILPRILFHHSDDYLEIYF